MENILSKELFNEFHKNNPEYDCCLECSLNKTIHSKEEYDAELSKSINNRFEKHCQLLISVFASLGYKMTIKPIK